MPDKIDLNSVSVVATLCVASTFFLFCSLLCTRWLRHFLPPQRHYFVPWSFLEILLALLIYLSWSVLGYGFLAVAGLVGEPPSTLPSELREASQLQQTLRIIWMSLAVLPFQIYTVGKALQAISGTQPYQVGLSTHRWRDNIAAGVTGCMIVLPLVAIINGVMIYVCSEAGLAPQEHPLTKIVKRGIRPLDWAALVGMAVIHAPIVEELACRGLLQRWLVTKSWGGALALAMAFGFTLLQCGSDMGRALGAGRFANLMVASAPLVFVALASLGLLAADNLGDLFDLRPREARAIFGVAVLFGALHTMAWPTPIALTLLGLYLGWLSHRTQSVVPVIVLHGLFNAVSCVMLFIHSLSKS